MLSALFFILAPLAHRISQGVMQMKCAWQAFINLLPTGMRKEADHKGRDACQELRLRLHQVPQLILKSETSFLTQAVTKEDIAYVINTASRYSPWAAATISQGYITAQGGHRIGICGQAVMKDGIPSGIREPTSLCMRVARDFPGIAQSTPLTGSALIIGSPGTGKTTFLRDMIRFRAQQRNGSVAVVDERGEIFPYWNGSACFSADQGIDVLTGMDKVHAVDMLLRTMGPGCVAMDEITAETDAQALSRAAWCGVDLLATAHASSKQDLWNRPIYRSLLSSGIFQHLIVMRRDQSWRMERIEQ